MENNSSYTPKRVMGVFAHPDDPEFGAAGTVARWVKEGAEAIYVLVTSGDVGIAEPGMSREKAATIREAEQRAAAAVVGVKEVVFLREPDGMVENTIALRKRLVREIRRFRPEVVITGDPTMVFTPMGGINHPDHRAVAGATIDAIFPASGQPHVFEELAEEGLQAHKVRKVYVTGRGQGDTYINIAATVALKIEALKQHVSQVGKRDDLDQRVREWTARTGEGKEMPHAESFRVITITGDEEWEKRQAE